MTIIPFPRNRTTGASARPPLRLDHIELRALLDLPRLRQLASEQIEDLIDLVDWIDGCPDLEPCCEDAGAQCDDEGADQCSGIADLDGLMEQAPSMFVGHCTQVLA